MNRLFLVILLIISTFVFGRIRVHTYATYDLVRSSDNPGWSNWTISTSDDYLYTDQSAADSIITKRVSLVNSTGAVGIYVLAQPNVGSIDCTVYAYDDNGNEVTLGSLSGTSATSAKYNLQDYQLFTSPVEYIYIKIMENSAQSTQYTIHVYVQEDL